MLSVSEFDSQADELLLWLVFLLISLSTYTQILV